MSWSKSVHEEIGFVGGFVVGVVYLSVVIIATCTSIDHHWWSWASSWILLAVVPGFMATAYSWRNIIAKLSAVWNHERELSGRPPRPTKLPPPAPRKKTACGGHGIVFMPINPDLKNPFHVDPKPSLFGPPVEYRM